MIPSARAALLLFVCAAPLAAQRRTCNIEFPNVAGVTRQIAYSLPSGERNVFLGGGVHAVCRRDRISIKADSAEYYGDEKRLFLVGHVIYDEPRIHLTSDYLTYFGIDERIIASSNVNVRMPSGSTMTGPQAEYLRRYPARPISVLTAVGRPTITLVERAAPGAKPEPPATVLATTFVVLADSLIHGSGQVEITRPDLLAKGDSTFIDSGNETIRLMRTPSIEGRQARTYTLKGEMIDLFSRRRKLQRAISRGAATATSDDMTLSADTIDLRVTDDLLEEAVAWGKGRARAKSPTQEIIADSIRALMPAQRVRTVFAIRTARAEGTPDSVRFRTTDRDWLTGDTIVAHFDTSRVAVVRTDSAAARRDSAGPRIRQLDAIGNARSYYHLASSDSSIRIPAINYVRGQRIAIVFDSQRVATVVVQGKADGIHLDPAIARDTATAARTPPASPTPTPGTPAPGAPAPTPASPPIVRPPPGRPGGVP